MKTIFTLLFALLVVGSFAQNQGEAAPDFTLKQLSGGDFKLSDQADKVVFIFWMGWDCPLCKAVAPSVKTEIIDAFKSDADFVAIGIDTWNGSTTGLNSFKSTTGLDINYLLSGSTIANTYSTTYDRVAVVDKKGVLVFKGTSATSGDLASVKTAITTALSVVTDVAELNENLTEFKNYPNPFQEQTTIQFAIEKSATVSLDVYDISGTKVREIVNRQYAPGNYSLPFAKGNLDRGLYFLRLQNDGFVTARKMLVQ